MHPGVAGSAFKERKGVASGMSGDAGALPTGNATLDAALDGGIPRGAVVYVESEEGAGGPEFAMTLLRQHADSSGAARFATALRAAARARRELDALFPHDKAAARVEVIEVADAAAALDAMALPAGSLAVLESATALARLAQDGDAVALHRRLAEAAASGGVALVLLAAPGALPAPTAAALAEASDVVLSFRWLEGGPLRRRLLRVGKVRGLASVLDAEQVPLFEVGLHRGRGFTVARISSLI